MPGTTQRWSKTGATVCLPAIAIVVLVVAANTVTGADPKPGDAQAAAQAEKPDPQEAADDCGSASQVSDVTRHDDGSIRSFNVWFFANVPANQAVSYTIEPGRSGLSYDGAAIKATKDTIELTTRAPKTIGIRLLGGSREYPYPVPAAEAPGPIRSLLLPSGRTTGAGRFEVPFHVTSYTAEVRGRSGSTPVHGVARVVSGPSSALQR